MSLSPDQFTAFHRLERGTHSSREITIADRGEGHGSDLMQQVTADADRLGAELQLHARPELHPWYGRFGFSPAGEDAMGNLMKRAPQEG